MEINLSYFDHDFCLIRCRSLPFYVLLKIFLCLHGVQKEKFGLTQVNFSVDKCYFHEEILSACHCGGWVGQPFFKKKLFGCHKCIFIITGESKQLAIQF